ncbi:MAG: glycosyltransferase [Actinomycetes bacterium]
MRIQKENKILTIAILTFNRSKMLEELLKSITSNSKEVLSKIEILILDNGSTDETSEIIKKYTNSLNIKGIREELNIRGSIRYKQLIKISQGNFIIFPGDDDIFIDNIFERIIQELESYSSDVTLVSAGAEVVDQNNNLLRIEYKLNDFKDKAYEIAELFEKSIYWMPATFIRTSVITNFEAPNSVTSFDWYMWILAATKGRTELIQEKIIKYRQHLEKEQNSYLQANWDIDELIMFIYAIQNGAIHTWLSISSDSTLKLFINHLNEITKNNKRGKISIIKYVLLIQELSKYTKYQKIINEIEIKKLESIDPRFLQAMTGLTLQWISFKNIFEKLDLVFKIDSDDLTANDGMLIQISKNNFLLKIFSENKLVFEDLLNESELLNKILDYYNEIMRDKRRSEIDDQITPFEWRVVNTVRKIRKLRYGKTFNFKSKV